MAMEKEDDALAERHSRSLIHQLSRLEQIMETLTATFEEMALHADIRTGESFKSQAADAIAKAMKT
jgi:glutamine synthetase type III